MLVPVVSAAEGAESVSRQAVAGPVLLHFASVENASDEEKLSTQVASTWAVATKSATDDTVFALLHGGLDVAILDCTESADSAEPRVANSAEAGITRNRLGYAVQADNSNDASHEKIIVLLQQLAPLCSVVLLQMGLAAAQGLTKEQARALVKAAGGDATTVALCVTPLSDVHVDPCGLSAKRVAQLHAFGVHVVGLPASPLPAARGHDTPAPEATEITVGEKLDVAHTFALCARSDRTDGLIPTVVTDEYERALGLVYSSRQSLVFAITEGRGIYYSRSRASLWRKGDTSGMWQALLSIRLDCDSDAVLFQVQQFGDPPAFCHKFTRSCWGDSAGIPGLERTLWSRKADAPAGSYTKRLFDDRELLRHKLLEEVQEQHEALQEGDKDHLAAETADVLYFAMVAAAAGGVKLRDVEAHLDRRALHIKRRKGDAKAHRIAAAEAALADAPAAAAASSGK